MDCSCMGPLSLVPMLSGSKLPVIPAPGASNISGVHTDIHKYIHINIITNNKTFK